MSSQQSGAVGESSRCSPAAASSSCACRLRNETSRRVRRCSSWVSASLTLKPDGDPRDRQRREHRHDHELVELAADEHHRGGLLAWPRPGSSSLGNENGCAGRRIRACRRSLSGRDRSASSASRVDALAVIRERRARSFRDRRSRSPREMRSRRRAGARPAPAGARPARAAGRTRARRRRVRRRPFLSPATTPTVLMSDEAADLHHDDQQHEQHEDARLQAAERQPQVTAQIVEQVVEHAVRPDQWSVRSRMRRSDQEVPFGRRPPRSAGRARAQEARPGAARQIALTLRLRKPSHGHVLVSLLTPAVHRHIRRRMRRPCVRPIWFNLRRRALPSLDTDAARRATDLKNMTLNQ